MSTSSLTALPSSDAPASERSLALPEPSRPTARRTYGGRRREPSPQPDSDAPSLAALFASSDSARASDRSLPKESPSKALLNRFSTSATGWMTSLGGLGAGDDDDAEEGPVDEEALKREMARLRQVARGTASSRTVDLPAPSAISEPRRFAAVRLHATSSTSTLTAAPTSPLRSSPPPALSSSARPAAASEDDTADSEPKLAHVSESDQETRPIQKRRSSTPTSQRSVTPTPATKSMRSRHHSSSPPEPPAPAPKINKFKAKANRLQAFMAGLDDDEEDEPAAASLPRSSPPKSDPVHDFLATLQGDDDEDDDAKSNEDELVKRTSSISVGLFDDEEESTTLKNGKQKKIKSLPKKDVAQMHKDVAAAKRERHFQPFKPEVDRLPVSSWAKKAQNIFKDPLPPLVKDNGSPGSSPAQITPDEITAFTPSSSSKPDGRPSHKDPRSKTTHALSPTPRLKGHPEKPNESDEDEEAGISLNYRLDKDLARMKERDLIEAKRRLLFLKKEAIIRELKWQGRVERGADADEELSITPKPEPVVRFADVKPSTSHRTAKSVLDNFMNHHNQIAKNRQAVLKLAGRNSSPHEEVTETMADFAGKTFKHADMRAANGGARPAGQKRNREVLITQNDLNHLTMAQHQQQAVLLRKKKEMMFNIKKKMVIPPRQTEKLDEMIESLAAREQAGISLDDEEDEDEEGEDDDFEPSGSEADREEEEAGEALQYSGDEGEAVKAGAEDGNIDTDAEEDDTDRMDIELEADVDGDKENEPPVAESSRKAESSLSLGTPRQPLATTSRSQRTPLGEIEADQSTSTPRGFASTFVDVGGFGSGGGSPGFSQLFEATQAAGPSGEADAFAALRDQHDMLLPSHALLPQVEITKTQIERDNAMIAADGEGDNGDDILDERPKTQYLNDNGLFTQTRPLARTKDASTTSRDNLAGSSVLFDDLVPEERDDGYDLSSTQKGTSEGDGIEDDEDADSSPRSGTPTRRHSLAATEGDDVDQDVQRGDEPAQSRPVDAFAKLMSAGQRPLTKHQKRAKRLIRSNLVDEQAEESDEDDWMVGSKSDDEEENEGEEDAYLAELVNDEAVSEEDKRKQDELATAKAREMQMEDDAKRESAARKITEGEYRHKRRGKDFWSDDEDGSPRKKRWSKKERRARKAWKEDGLEKLDGEQNVFHEFYDNDLDSDVDSVEEMPTPRKKTTSATRSDSVDPMPTQAERLEMLRRVARMNKQATSYEEVDLDKELGLGRAASEEGEGDTDTEPVEEESQYSISRSTRILNSVTEVTTSKTKLRSAESYQAFVRDESQLTRRTGAIGAASVVYNKGAIPTGKPSYGNRPHLSKQRASGPSSSSGGSILMSKTGKFA